MINTESHLKYSLRCTRSELNYVTENIGCFYYFDEKPKKKYGEFQRDSKGKIKKRKLYPSVGPLKKMQERTDKFLKKIKLPSYAYGCVRGKDNIQNAIKHVNNKYFLTIDLKNFFSNISHQQVFKIFRDHHFSPTIARILTRLTTINGGLSQGAPSSPVIANLVFTDTGNQLDFFAQRHNLTFTSYLDDLTFSSKTNFKKCVPAILTIIKAGNFFINHKKIHYSTYFPEVTGIFIKDNQLFVNDTIKKRATICNETKQYLARIESANKMLRNKN